MKAEVHAGFLAPFAEEASKVVGNARVLEILRDAEIDPSVLNDKSAWISLAQLETCLTLFDERVGDPLLLRRAARLSFTDRYMGPLRTLIRAFATPSSAYAQMAKGLQRFNKVGVLEVREQRRGATVLAYRPAPGAPRERVRFVCDGRRENMISVPTIFDLPPAEIEHPKCLHDGDDECVYVIKHAELRARGLSRFAFVVGAGVGAALSYRFVGADLTPLLAGGTLGAFSLRSMARQRELSAELTESAHLVAEQQDSLIRTTIANEQHYAELLEAKTAVDQQVEERTAELRATSEQLQETLGEVQALDRAKTDFFANVSHDLRTPLTLILSPLEALRRGESPPGGAEAAFEAMHLASTRLLVLIDRLLDLAKADSGKERLDLRSTDMNAFLHGLGRAFGLAATSRGVTLEVDARVDVPLEVDPRWFDSALSNLVGNALRFAKSRIILRARDVGGEIAIEVEDDGPGVPEADRAMVFERFGQASEEARRRSGTGLGLAIVREAARLHGGRATLEASSLGGARFVLLLPRRVASGPAVAPVLKEAHIDAPPPADLAGPRPDAPLALVAEDNPDLRRFISEVLATRFRVRATVDGVEALSAAQAERPDLVVTDVAMPRMTGLELCRALRADTDLRDIPIIMVTARGEPTEVLEGFDAGADDYVLKPFHGRELLARIDVQLRLRMLARELAHKERLASLGVLAASVAHHVRNPLTALVSGLPAMRRRLQDKVDDRTKEMLDVFIESAQRIEQTTVDLLDLSRVDRQAEDDVRPGGGLGAAIRLLSARIPTGVIIDTAIDLEPTLRGRPADLNHAFLNLIDNAAHAVGTRGRIRVSGTREGDEYIVRIEDSGPGVPEAMREEIFEYFTSTRGAGKGAGIGLAIVRDVAHRHGGGVRVDRSPDLGGARFTFSLPLAKTLPASGSTATRGAGPHVSGV